MPGQAWRNFVNETNSNGDGPANPKPELKFSFEKDLGGALQGGMEAIKKLFEGFATMAQGLVGPEAVRNFEAGQWLERVAICLDETAALLREASQVTPEKTGELTCFLERVEEELKGSKFASQQSALHQRLQNIHDQISTPGDSVPFRVQATQVAEAAGYFHAAAKSAIPAGTQEGNAAE